MISRPSDYTYAPAFDMTASIALIDELIACDDPGMWDRSMMLGRLRRDKAAYVNTLEISLEVCHLVNAQLAGRPNRRLSERLATCIWYNPDMHHFFREEIAVSADESELADQIEEVLDLYATSQPDAVGALAVCQGRAP